MFEREVDIKLSILILNCRDIASLINKGSREFPDSPVVKTPYFYSRAAGWIPGWRTKMLHAARAKTETK